MQHEKELINNYNNNKFKSINNILILLIIFSIPLSTIVTNILISLFLLFWIIEGNYQTKINITWQYPACFAPIILLIALLLGSTYSYYANLTEIIMFLKKMVKLIYIPFFIYYFTDKSQRDLSINALIAASIITSLIGLYYNTPTPFKNTIDTSLVTIIASFLLLHKLNSTTKLYLNCIIILLSLLNIFYLFYISCGRTSQAIFLLLIPIFFIQKIKSLKSKYLISICISLITIIFAFCIIYSFRLQNSWNNILISYKDYKTNPLNFNHNSVSYRLTFYKNSLDLIKQKPLFGWGTGSFAAIYKQFATNHYNILTPNPHNEYLLWGTQLGLFGVSLLLWWFYSLFKTSLILKNYEQHILQGLIVIFMLGCLANSWVMDFVSGHLLIMLVSISLGALPYGVKPNS